MWYSSLSDLLHLAEQSLGPSMLLYFNPIEDKSFWRFCEIWEYGVINSLFSAASFLCPVCPPSMERKFLSDTYAEGNKLPF